MQTAKQLLMLLFADYEKAKDGRKFLAGHLSQVVNSDAVLSPHQTQYLKSVIAETDSNVHEPLEYHNFIMTTSTWINSCRAFPDDPDPVQSAKG